ncbi:MAG: hypothetical protein RLZZ299_493 [Pseudomonadota bacterium]
MRTLAIVLLSLVCLAWSPSARAECRSAYTTDQLVSDLEQAIVAMREQDLPRMGAVTRRLETDLVCLGRTAPPPVFANAYRLIGAYYFLGVQDVPKARRWFRVALEVDPSHDWDSSELPMVHPMRQVYEEERMAAASSVVPLEGMIIVKPAGSMLFVDGRPLENAEATTERPHIVQQVAKDGTTRGAFLIEGNAIPAQYLRPESTLPQNQPVAAPEDPNVTYSEDGVKIVKVERTRPREKTPLIVSGLLGMVGAGGVYALAYIEREDFELAATTTELQDSASLVNTLVATSGGVAALGLGVAYWGLILDGGAPTLPTWGTGF